MESKLRFCPYCGCKLPDSDIPLRFCHECGTRLPSVNGQQNEPQPVVAPNYEPPRSAPAPKQRKDEANEPAFSAPYQEPPREEASEQPYNAPYQEQRSEEANNSYAPTQQNAQNNTAQKQEEPTKSNSKLKAGVILFPISVIVLGAMLIACVAAGWGVISVVFGVFFVLLGFVFLGIVIYVNLKERKEKFCPKCKGFYDYNNDISWAETNRYTKRYNINPNGNGKQIIAKLFYDFRVDCTCHKCGHTRSYNKKVEGGEAYLNGTEKYYDPEEAMDKYYLNPNIGGGTKRQSLVFGIIAGVFFALALMFPIIAFATSGKTNGMPSQYYGTYVYGDLSSSYQAFTFDEESCTVVSSNGENYPNLKYEYYPAKKAHRQHYNPTYEGCALIVVYLDKNNGWYLWITKDINENITLTLDSNGRTFNKIA